MTSIRKCKHCGHAMPPFRAAATFADLLADMQKYERRAQEGWEPQALFGGMLLAVKCAIGQHHRVCLDCIDKEWPASDAGAHDVRS